MIFLYFKEQAIYNVNLSVAIQYMKLYFCILFSLDTDKTAICFGH